MRLVLDTNILLSALMTRGTPPDQLYQAWHRHEIELITSEAQLAELTRVIAYPQIRKRIMPDEATALLDGLRTRATLVENPPDIHLSRDSDDNRILATALAGNADYLVSGDNDLLILRKVESVAIITAREAVSIISALAAD